ncbi:hypothetical protein F5Y08DRAFT_350952 [Xylaria arbuscula]|nr:hypothetical protein F5Y08DRAFT_350952 [Xylaria arbuscula]
MPRPKSDRERLKARQNRINRLTDLIEQIRHGKYLEKGEVIQRQLFPRDYTELLLKLEERGPDLLHLFHHELRYEYRESIRGKAQFTIIFRQLFRKSIAISITCKVDRWIQNLVEDPNSSADCRRVAGKILSMYGMRLTFPSKTLRSDSDFLYDEEHCENPSVIFEIAWSQSTAGLEKKAIEIIEEGDGEIRTVVGLDFSKTYSVWDTLRDEIGSKSSPKRGPCTAFVWRAAFNKNGQLLFEHGRPMLHKNTYVFCDEDGMAVPDQKLTLHLWDFVPVQVMKAEGWGEIKALGDANLEIDTAAMLDLFDKALRCQRKEDRVTQRLKQERDELKRMRNATS